MAKTQKSENVVFKKKKGFTQVQNWAPDDMSLSDKALGLYTRIQRWITFETEDFECSKAFIRTKSPSGEKAFDSAWAELKDRGYLKMYCQMATQAVWTAELLDEPQPGTPHTYYLNAKGEISKTNVDMAAEKAYRKSGIPQKGGTPKRSTPNGSTGNGGNNINPSLNPSYKNSFSNKSINHSEELPQNGANNSPKSPKDRLIDTELIEAIKKQISYDVLMERHDTQWLDNAVNSIAALYTVTEPQMFAKVKYAPDVVHDRATEIQMHHVDYVWECFKAQESQVRNVVDYLRACFFNAPATIDAYYTNKVKADDANRKKEEAPENGKGQLDGDAKLAIQRLMSEVDLTGERNEPSEEIA